MHPEKYLLVALLLMTFASLLLYFPLNRGHARYYLETAFDRTIPFISLFIFPYLAFIPFVIFGLFAVFFTPYAERLYLAVIIAVLSGSLVRYFIHSGIRQPRIRRIDISDRLVHWLYRNDDRAHTFPSTHVLVSLTMSYYSALAFPLYAGYIWIIGGLIALSTVFVKQHYIVDVIGGIAFAFGAIALTHVLV